MKKLTVLVTGGGAPGIVGTIFSLRNNPDNRDVRIVTTDVKEEVIGKYISDSFYEINKANDKLEYLKDVLDISRKEAIDVIIPQNTAELLLLAKEKKIFEENGTKVLISDYSNMVIANDKYELMNRCCRLNIPFPAFKLVDNFCDLKKSVELLGYPDRPVLVKPPNSNGSRGIRIIDEKKNYNQLFYNEKPTNLFVKLNHLYDLIGENFNPLLVMEYLPGEEITIDVYRDDKLFLSIPRRRDEVRSGISFCNSALRSDELNRYSELLANDLDLKYCFGFQFKMNYDGVYKILECNPRVQGTMVYSTFMGFNMIYSAVKFAVGETIADFTLDWETKLLRYWGAIGVNGKGVIKL